MSKDKGTAPEALSPAQAKVVDLLLKGWELGYSKAVGFKESAWVQEGGVGKGGKSEPVKTDTFGVLLRKGVLEAVSRPRFSLIIYKLSDTYKNQCNDPRT